MPAPLATAFAYVVSATFVAAVGPAGVQEWRVVNSVPVKTTWRVAELEFYGDTGCTERLEIVSSSNYFAPLRQGQKVLPPHPGEDCWGHCGGKAGYCDFCGDGGACCKKGFASDPVECHHMSGYSGVLYHECVGGHAANNLAFDRNPQTYFEVECKSAPVCAVGSLVLGTVLADKKDIVKCIVATQLVPDEYSCNINKMSLGACVGPCPLKNIKTIEQCEAECSKNAASGGGCGAIMYNRYGSCYLKKDNGALQNDLPEHQTVSCTRKLVSTETLGLQAFHTNEARSAGDCPGLCRSGRYLEGGGVERVCIEHLSEHGWCGSAPEFLSGLDCSGCKSMSITPAMWKEGLFTKTREKRANGTVLVSRMTHGMWEKASQRLRAGQPWRTPVLHVGEDCLEPCHGIPGYCSWCGEGNACCKSGADAPAECRAAIGFVSEPAIYECVSLSHSARAESTSSSLLMIVLVASWAGVCIGLCMILRRSGRTRKTDSLYESSKSLSGDVFPIPRRDEDTAARKAVREATKNLDWLR